MARRKPFFCPGCGKHLPPAYSRSHPARNMRVKYIKCPCGRRLKTIERLLPTNPQN